VATNELAGAAPDLSDPQETSICARAARSQEFVPAALLQRVILTRKAGKVAPATYEIILLAKLDSGKK
jgi:hypothetical protein